MALAFYFRDLALVPYYDGLTPTIYANTIALGTGSGASEVNATTFTDALANATAGDIIGVLPGVYSGAPAGTAHTPIFSCTNSGTAGNPIIVVGKYDHLLYYTDPSRRCEIRSNSPTFPVYPTNANNPGIGCRQNQNYIQWRNFFLDWNYCPPRPSNGMALLGVDGTGNRFRKLVFSLEPSPTGLDNYDAMFVKGQVDGQIDYCYVYGGSTVGINQNANCIEIYAGDNTLHTTNLIIEHNTFYDVNAGIFNKGRDIGTNQGSQCIIRYNKITDTTNDGIIHMGEDPTNGSEYYQNLLVRNRNGFKMENALNATTHQYGNAHIYNNTVVDPTTTGYLLESYPDTLVNNTYVFRDNIIALTASSSARMIDIESPLSATEFSTLNYNLYYEAGATAQFRIGASNSSGIAAWRTATSKEANSSETDPGFVNAASDNYHLAGTDTGSSTGGARGCYITGTETIGNGVH